MAEAALILVLHDVAPATWPAYRDFLCSVDALGPVPLTLLVVPDFHRRGALDAHPGFVAALHRRLERGDELVLHGYYHDDPGPVPLRQRPRRRLYTREGEFLSLPRDEATDRLTRGLALFRRLHLPVRGFVPPAWLLGMEARAALADSGLAYTSSRTALLALPDFTPHPAPGLVWSARSAARRALSRAWNAALLRRHAGAPLLRLGLHPVDLAHPTVSRFWLRTLERLLKTRRPLTKGQWLATRPSPA